MEENRSSFKSLSKGDIKSSNDYCFKCGNKGFLDKECPSCGRVPKSLRLDFEKMSEKQTNEFVERIDKFGVPGKYRGVFWEKEILLKHFSNKANDFYFQKFVEQLDKVNNVFGKGVLSNKSAIIVAPAGYSKEIFAYSCMQRAIQNGFSVAPYLDTVELKRLLVLAGENPQYKLYGSITYDEYVMSDVCFITVTKLRQREWAYEVIQEIIDRRSRKGLATFIVSRYGLSEISRRDKSNSFDAVAYADSDDDFKYPAVIKYSE